MKISTRTLLTNLGFLVVILLMSVLAMYQLRTLEKTSADEEIIGRALRSQMEADMMHDGLRADVLFALRAAESNDPKLREEALASTAEHIENFKNQIAKVEKLGVSPEANGALSKLKEPLERYTNSARRLTQESFANLSEAKEDYDSFQKDFEYLEEGMGNLGDVIQAEFERINKEADAKSEKTKTIIAFAVIFSFLFSGFNWLVTRNDVVKPLVAMTASMTSLSGGNIDAEVPAFSKKDEIGEMAKALRVFKDNAIETRRMSEAQKQAEKEAERKRKDDMNRIADAFESQVMGVIRAVSAAAEQMQASAQSLSGIAGDTSNQVSAVSTATEEASANVQSVAAAIEEFTSSIQEINRQIAGTTHQSREASEEANRTTQLVDTLQQTSQGIGEVVALIQAISEQTNLLALNATIEAARAGDAGKGVDGLFGEGQ